MLLILLGYADVTLTFYQIHRLKKLGMYDKFHEVNPIGRALIGQAKPLNMLVCYLWSMVSMSMITFMCFMFFADLWVVYLCFIVMMQMLIIYHMTNLRHISKLELMQHD